MKKIIFFKVTRITIFLLNLSLFIQSEIEDDSSMRAFSCYNLMNKKFKGKDEPQPTVYSPLLLSCYIKISEDQSQKVLSSMESDEMPLEQNEIDELFNIDNLREIPQDEINQKKEELEKEIKEFQKFNKDYNDSKEDMSENYDDFNYDDDYNYDDYNNYGEYNEDFNYNDDMNYNDYYNNDYNDNENENSSILKDFFNENKGLWIGIFICVIVFVLILLFGKDYDETEKLNKNE